MRKNMPLTREEREIRRLLLFFLDYCPNGLLPFFGETAYPDGEVIYEAKQAQSIDRYRIEHNGAVPEAVHVSGGSGKPYAQAVVEVADSVAETIRKYGGMSAFYAAFQELKSKRRMSRNMYILRDLSRKGATTDTTEDIAAKYYICAQHVWKARNRALDALARNIGARREAKRFLQTEGE